MIQWRAWGWVLALWLVTMSMGCATIVESLKKDLEKGDYEEVIEDADSWIKAHKEDAGASKVRRQVEILQATARLGQASTIDTVEAYNEFRKRHYSEHYAALVTQAVEFESRAWYRDNTLPQASVNAHQYFRSLYPLSSLIPTSRQAESAIALARAIRLDTIEAHQEYRVAYQGWEEAVEHLVESKKAEVRIAFREAQATKRWQALEMFRERYEDWPEAKEAITLARESELKLALEDAITQDNAAAFKRLRLVYGQWPEATSQLQFIREQEVHHAFDEAKASIGYEALRSFRSSYQDWSEAEDFLAQAYVLETQRAFDEAVLSEDPDKLVAFREQYSDEDWQKRAREAEASMVFKPLFEAVTERRPLSDEFVQAWIDRNSELGHVRQAAASHEYSFWSWVQRQDKPSSYRLFAALYPDSTHAADAQRRERDRAWTIALATASKEGFLDFAQRYVNDSRASLAEQRYYNLIKVERAREGYPRAQLTSRRDGSRDQVELYVDVRDCFNERVSGLGEQDFEIFIDGEQVPVTRFIGLEDPQPLDIVFQIDLSGSMSTEINAVQSAVIQFAEVFRFRGRQTRLGLVTFSDDLQDVVPLTRDINVFQRQVGRIGRTLGGGAAEDSTHALLKGSDLLSTSRAERVSILLTDEHLQVNQGGRKALGGQANADCRKAQRVATCLGRCRHSAACLNRCYMTLGAEARRAMQQCVGLWGHKRCARNVNWYALISSLNVCGTPVHSYSLEMNMLVQHLNRRKVRPYLLVPEDLFGFETLASETQGQVIHVPQEGSDEEPYIDALMEIADQLSRQYVFSVPATALDGGGRVDVLTRPGHIWVGRGRLPQKGVLGLFSGENADPKCPNFVLVTVDEGVYISQQCGTVWQSVGEGILAGPMVAAAQRGNRVALLNEAGELYEVNFDGVNAARVELDVKNLAVIASGSQGALYMVGQVKDFPSWSLMKLDARGLSEIMALTPLAFNESAPIPLIHPEVSNNCAIVAHDKMMCINSDGLASSATVKGLSAAAFEQGIRISPVPGRPGVFLALTSDGSIMRSFNGGLRWVEVAPAVEQKRDLIFVPGQFAVACVASTTSMLCSEDAGLTWFEVGRSFDEKAQSALVSVGQRLYMAQNGQLQRLERVVNREIPSTSVYFATNARRPQANMMPFLRNIAVVMQRDSSLVLRVEGHTDHRGAAEYNDQLAADRANSIIDIIASEGVEASRLQAVSYGEHRPIRSDGGANALAINRRVEIILMRPDVRLSYDHDPCREP